MLEPRKATFRAFGRLSPSTTPHAPPQPLCRGLKREMVCRGTILDLLVRPPKKEAIAPLGPAWRCVGRR